MNLGKIAFIFIAMVLGASRAFFIPIFLPHPLFIGHAVSVGHSLSVGHSVVSVAEPVVHVVHKPVTVTKTVSVGTPVSYILE